MINMAPFPEEIDVFSVPHLRMKKLVELYLEKLSCTDFADHRALESLLSNLDVTFCEFQSHEHIENMFIMRKLRSRLEELSLYDSAVCNCHSDDRLSEVLALVRDGYHRASGPLIERLDYGHRLRDALNDFTDNFLPHMRTEEEVFQPMLMKYFEYEELRTLKDVVIEQHEIWKRCECGHVAKPTVAVPKQTGVHSLPPEVLLHIFKYLPVRDLTRCSQVCHSWQLLAFHPPLWRTLCPTQWARGCWSWEEKCYFAEEDPFFESVGKDLCQVDVEVNPAKRDFAKRERAILEGLVRVVLPRVGHSVDRLVLSGSHQVDAKMLLRLLLGCPVLRHLNMSFSNVCDAALLRIPATKMPQLTSLSIDGCVKISDKGFLRLLGSNREGSGVRYLSLSGCSKLTDISITVPVLEELTYLDVSGCWRMSGGGLCEAVARCAHLYPENLYYCNRVLDGPHADLANGCQNLESDTRLCCQLRD